MRKVTRDEAIQMGVRPETWDVLHALPKSNLQKLAATRAVNLLRRVTMLEKKHGPIKLY